MTAMVGKIIEIMVLEQPLEGRRLNTDGMTDLPTIAAALLANFATIRLRRCERLWTWPMSDPSLTLYCKVLEITLGCNRQYLSSTHAGRRSSCLLRSARR